MTPPSRARATRAMALEYRDLLEEAQVASVSGEDLQALA